MEVLESLECIIAFQHFPQGWEDHRRPIDTHIQVTQLTIADM